MKLLVCGGRGYNDRAAFDAAMDRLPFTPTLIIEGDALGTDRMAREWAKARGIHFATVPALWYCYENAAGGKRNTAMLILKPDYCLAMLARVTKTQTDQREAMTLSGQTLAASVTVAPSGRLAAAHTKALTSPHSRLT